ncbi:hypothetical protein SteCoe_37265 [Stentor coeruleus]|uniref:EF-hand domain-containing protein n=1 Tax=Stentor coeruleus TaxID=5963 RepID=A0A1R2ANL8_9CILI|nr:hypothetical protein SteCoe_37265 [Stentor coeruleus]
MNHIAKRNTRNIAEQLFEEMDIDKKGSLNLENMRKLYEEIQGEYKEIVRDKLRKFVIDNQKFLITKEEFIHLFPRNPTPCVHINLSHIKEPQRIKELSPSELRNVISKRMESKAVNSYKPKFIKKSRSSSRPLIRVDNQDKVVKNKDLFYVRKAYFSSLS